MKVYLNYHKCWDMVNTAFIEKYETTTIIIINDKVMEKSNHWYLKIVNHGWPWLMIVDKGLPWITRFGNGGQWVTMFDHV